MDVDAPVVRKQFFVTHRRVVLSQITDCIYTIVSRSVGEHDRQWRAVCNVCLSPVMTVVCSRCCLLIFAISLNTAKIFGIYTL